MALRQIFRKRVPTDGTWVRTKARLASLIREAIPPHCDFGLDGDDSTQIVVEARLWPHGGEKTQDNPSGIYFHAQIRYSQWGSHDEGSHGHRVTLGHVSPYLVFYRDSRLDGWDSTDKWIYSPLAEDVAEGFGKLPGEDVSVYECNQCEGWNYLDPEGRRFDRSACMFDGELVCRDCDTLGLVYSQDVSDRLAIARTLSARIGDDCLQQFENRLNLLGRRESWGFPAQTRLFLDGETSFFWIEKVRREDGWKYSLRGGLIFHGPYVKVGHDGSFTFTKWDYDAARERPATEEEIAASSWGIHT